MIYRGIVKSGVIHLEDGSHLPEGTHVIIEPLENETAKTEPLPGTSLADWAEENAEDWGDRLNSEDVESFTGRRFSG